MTSLTDVYEGRVGRVATRRRQLTGSGLFLAGVAMVVGAIGVATTDVGVQLFGRYPAREIAGILAGLGLPAVLLGVFTVLPAARQVQAAAVIGTGIATLGVVLFQHAYPYNWVAGAPLFALATTAVYFLGVASVFWCLFVALATFKTRNDPGGTARMEITREGTIRVVEEARSLGRFGGIALFGNDPEGDVETQTNRDTTTTDHDGSVVDGPTVAGAVGDGGATDAGIADPQSGIDQGISQSGPSSHEFDTDDSPEEQWEVDQLSTTPTRSSGSTASTGSGETEFIDADEYDRSPDGGTAATGGTADVGSETAATGTMGAPGTTTDSSTTGVGGDPATTDAPSDHQVFTGQDEETGIGEPDQYCGNCRHFEYVMEDGETVPYCGLHEEPMDDMDACSGWLER